MQELLLLLLIDLTQTVCEFVIASPLGRGNLLIKCCDNRRSTRRFPRRSAPRNDRLAVCLNKADKHIAFLSFRFRWCCEHDKVQICFSLCSYCIQKHSVNYRREVDTECREPISCHVFIVHFLPLSSICFMQERLPPSGGGLFRLHGADDLQQDPQVLFLTLGQG